MRNDADQLRRFSHLLRRASLRLALSSMSTGNSAMSFQRSSSVIRNGSSDQYRLSAWLVDFLVENSELMQGLRETFDSAIGE